MKFVMTIILTMMMVVLTAKLLNMVLRAPPMKPDCHRVLPPVAMGKKRRMKICDDGDSNDGDGCSAQCTIEFGFQCTGDLISACVSTCGDGLLAADEACDVGDNDGTTGCDTGCKRSPMAMPAVAMNLCVSRAGMVYASNEACDDGNTETDDGCNANCSAVAQGFICETEGMLCFSTCGDGILASDEVCDDNNTANDDGCSADCMQVELHWTCTENETGLSACNDSCGDGGS